MKIFFSKITASKCRDLNQLTYILTVSKASGKSDLATSANSLKTYFNNCLDQMLQM